MKLQSQLFAGVSLALLVPRDICLGQPATTGKLQDVEEAPPATGDERPGFARVQQYDDAFLISREPLPEEAVRQAHKNDPLRESDVSPYGRAAARERRALKMLVWAVVSVALVAALAYFGAKKLTMDMLNAAEDDAEVGDIMKKATAIAWLIVLTGLVETALLVNLIFRIPLWFMSLSRLVHAKAKASKVTRKPVEQEALVVPASDEASIGAERRHMNNIVQAPMP